jgi:hypothetical protein
MRSSSRLSSILVPSIANIFFLAVFAHLAFSVGTRLLNDADTGYHIRAGEYILETSSIPRLDMFSYHLPPYPWTAHEWLSEIIMALIHNLAGLTGVVLFFAGLIAMTFVILYRFVRNQGANLLIILPILILAVVTSTNHWLARPHIFSFVLVTLWYGLLDRFELTGAGRKTMLWAMPLMMLLWVNLHGGYILGFVILGVYGLSNLLRMLWGATEERPACRDRFRHLFIVGLICLVAALVNPFGYHILLFPFKLLGESYLMDHVNEFISPDFHGYGSYKAMIYLVVIAAALSVRRFSLVELILVLLLTHMSLYSARHVPLFAIITTPIIVRRLQELLDSGSGAFVRFIHDRGARYAAIDDSAKGFLWPLTGMVVIAWAVAGGTIDYRFDPKLKPVAAVEFMEREVIPGRMFNNDEFGDYIVYKSWPKSRVFIDGRLDMYGVELLKEYYKVVNFEEGWEEIVSKYGFGWIIFNTDSFLSRHLVHHPDWQLIYSDPLASIFVRRTDDYARLVAKYPKVKLAPPVKAVNGER